MNSRQTLWPEITSPVAREILAAVYSQRCMYRENNGRLPEGFFTSVAADEYHSWLEDKLPKSGLSRQIPAGSDLLPDITATAPPLFRWLSSLRIPIYNTQMVGQIIDHLDWYMSPYDNYRGLFKKTIIDALFPCALAICALVSVIKLLLFRSMLLGIGLAFLFVSAYPVVAIIDTAPARIRKTINATLLFHYLKEAYCDPAEDIE